MNPELKAAQDRLAQVRNALETELGAIRLSDFQQHASATARGRMMAILASRIAGQAFDTWERAQEHYRHLPNEPYCLGKSSALGINLDSFIEMELSTIEGLLAEAERLAVEAANMFVRRNDEAPDVVLIIVGDAALWARTLYPRMKDISFTLRVIEEYRSSKRKDEPYIVLIQQAIELAEDGRKALENANNHLTRLSRRYRKTQEMEANVMGLDHASFVELGIRLAEHWLDHAEWLKIMAEELFQRAERLSITTTTEQTTIATTSE